MAEPKSATQPASHAAQPFVLNGSALQQYIDTQRATYVTRPGASVYFYSRMDDKTKVGDGGLQDFTQIPPTMKLVADSTDTTSTCLIREIVVNTTIDQDSYSQAAITLVQPQGVEYFSPTIGDKNIAPPDYDLNGVVSGKSGPKHRIGVMDTVLIKMSNVGNQVPRGTPMTETVFRGVIAEIRRTESVQGGSTIQLRLMDFSEFLRRLMAVNYGFFSTIAIAFTGRGLAFDALKYVNNILNGNNMLFQGPIGIETVEAAQNAATNAINWWNDNVSEYNKKNPNGQNSPITVDAQNPPIPLGLLSDAMEVAPFFYLEYSDKVKDGSLPSQLQATVSSVLQAAGNAEALASGTALSLINADSAASNVTPEDLESLSYYNIAPQGLRGEVKPQQTSATLTSLGVDYIERSWVAADIFLEPGMMNFEHQYIWNLLTSTAARAFREVFVDIKPKLDWQAKFSYQSADVPTQRAHPNLPDLHPNIAIVKYRLSPALIPYSDNHENSKFWQYKFTRDDVISYQGVESEQGVFTHTLVYGIGDSTQTILDLGSKFTRESKNLSIALPIDQNIMKRFGYRFLTDQDAKAGIPFLRYFLGYALLEKTQLSMFSQTVTLPGRPDIQAGAIVRLDEKNTDYYCTGVAHAWSFEKGYTTVLTLQYGHTKGRLPASYLGNSLSSGFDEQQCEQRHNTLKDYITTKTVGDVNVECLVEALWLYWCGGATSDSALKTYTKEYQTQALNHGANINASDDWINLVHQCPPSGQYQSPAYDAIINQYIQSYGLNKYNVTLNTVKNLIGQESQYNSPQWSVGGTKDDPSYGWYQLSFDGSGNCSEGGGLTVSQAEQDFIASTKVALNWLLHKFSANDIAPGCAGGDFLKGITAYNGLVPSSGSPFGYDTTYVNNVFSPDQVKTILQGTQKPGPSANVQQGQSGAWPYYCYGPCGLRVAQVNESLASINPLAPNSNYNSVKSQLLDFKSGMTASVSYIVGLLNKYNDPNKKVMVNVPSVASQAQTAFANSATGINSGLYNPTASSATPMQQQDLFSGLIDQNNLLEKAIAAWYSNEAQQSYDPAFSPPSFTAAKNAIIQLYQNCVACNSINTSGDIFSEHNATTQTIKGIPNRKWLVDNINIDSIQCPNGRDDLLDANKTSNQLIAMMTELRNRVNSPYLVTCVRKDHHSNDSGMQQLAHNVGDAVDLWPGSGDTVYDFIGHINNITHESPNLIYLVGFGGSTKGPSLEYTWNGPMLTSSGPFNAPGQAFTDNTQDHIHLSANYTLNVTA